MLFFLLDGHIQKDVPFTGPQLLPDWYGIGYRWTYKLSLLQTSLAAKMVICPYIQSKQKETRCSWLNPSWENAECYKIKGSELSEVISEQSKYSNKSTLCYNDCLNILCQVCVSFLILTPCSTTWNSHLFCHLIG